MAVLDYTADVWRHALGLGNGQGPRTLILEGTWWRKAAVENRLSQLDDVRELPFPDIFVGTHQGIEVAYCCAYGAPRAAEPAHVFAQIGTPLLVQIGTCGVLVPNIGIGTVLLPDTCRACDGVSEHYGGGLDVALDPYWIARAAAHLADLSITTGRARHITWPSLFAQSDSMCARWAEAGFVSVDMETSVVATIARRYGVAAVSLLSAWDALLSGRTFLDPLDPPEAAALSRANDAVFTVALRLAQEVAQRGAASKGAAAAAADQLT